MSMRSQRLTEVVPFWASLGLVPVAWIPAIYGGWTIVLMPLATWALFTLLDAVSGLDTRNPDPQTPEATLTWYRLITLVWAPVQALTVFAIIAYVARSGHLAGWEMAGTAFGLGILSGTVGIVYAHELMHRNSRAERWLGDILMAMAQYGHFRSEHLLVHHRYVGTPRDPVTARYNENFHRFFPRVLRQCFLSAWTAEANRLGQRNRRAWHPANPFWRYAALQAAFLLLALLLGGWTGLALYAFHALVAIWQLELVNYVEHYGLTRKHLGGGHYEHIQPRHSWNAAHRASNWILINLQRHSDHHARPDRRFPLLQTYGEDTAPQLPYGYPVMTLMALIPPLWRRRMNPRVRDWRRKFYPEITDWKPYTKGATPLPR